MKSGFPFSSIFIWTILSIDSIWIGKVVKVNIYLTEDLSIVICGFCDLPIFHVHHRIQKQRNSATWFGSTAELPFICQFEIHTIVNLNIFWIDSWWQVTHLENKFFAFLWHSVKFPLIWFLELYKVTIEISFLNFWWGCWNNSYWCHLFNHILLGCIAISEHSFSFS